MDESQYEDAGVHLDLSITMSLGRYGPQLIRRGRAVAALINDVDAELVELVGSLAFVLVDLRGDWNLALLELDEESDDLMLLGYEAINLWIETLPSRGLLLEKVKIETSHLGNRLGLKMAAALMAFFGEGCDARAAVPSRALDSIPMRDEIGYPFLGLHGYWSTLGFEQIVPKGRVWSCDITDFEIPADLRVGWDD